MMTPREKHQRSLIEREANTFALFLLMPRDFLMEEMLKVGSFDLTSDEPMEIIAKKFGVTKTALTVRLGLLGKEDKKKLGFR